MDDTLKPQVQKLLRELLKHQARMRKEVLINYKSLCERAGVPFNRATIGHFLYDVADWCERKGLPPINALVVQKASGNPGFNYSNAPGGRRSWAETVGECLTSKKYPKKV